MDEDSECITTKVTKSTDLGTAFKELQLHCKKMQKCMLIISKASHSVDGLAYECTDTRKERINDTFKVNLTGEN